MNLLWTESFSRAGTDGLTERSGFIGRITKRLLVVCVLAVASGVPFAHAADQELPKASEVAFPGWKMSWVQPGPTIVLVNQEGKEPLEICVGLARCQKDGEKDFLTVVGGAVKDGKVPTAAEAAADTSLSGVAKVLGTAEYNAWKASKR